MKEVKNLSTSKGTQESDIPTKITKDNPNIFADFLLSSFNTCIANSEFPSPLKLANITPVHKKDSINQNDNYRFLVYCQIYPKNKNDLCLNK